MMKIVYVSDEVARVTKAFAKNSCIFGTEEFKCWREYKAIYPNAKMEVRTIKKNPDKKTRRNMTYANMEAFIATLDNGKELLEKFTTIRKRSLIQKSPYQYVLDRFENTFENEIAMKDFMQQKEEERTQMKEDKIA